MTRTTVDMSNIERLLNASWTRWVVTYTKYVSRVSSLSECRCSPGVRVSYHQCTEHNDIFGIIKVILVYWFPCSDTNPDRIRSSRRRHECPSSWFHYRFEERSRLEGGHRHMKPSCHKGRGASVRTSMPPWYGVRARLGLANI